MRHVWNKSPGASDVMEDWDIEMELKELEDEGLLDMDTEEYAEPIEADEYAEIVEDGAEANYSWVEAYFLNGCI